METEYLPYFELKEISEEGIISGIASVYGVEDQGGDVIDKGAFSKTLKENESFPILWHHKSDEVIGEGTVKEWQGKLLLTAKLDMTDPTAQKAFSKLKAKLIKGLSIGFTTIKSTWAEAEGRMIRHIQELKLWEVSVVTFPMLSAAQVTRVKSMDEVQKLFTETQAKDAKIADLESQVQALQTKLATPPEEPARAEEPQQQQSTEPVDHSALSSKLTELRGIVWN